MKASQITDFISVLKNEFPSSNLAHMNCFRQLIIAGSFADWLKNQSNISSPSWNAIPDVNIYVIISGSPSEEIEAMTALGSLYNNIHQKFKSVSLLLDLHPFSMSISLGKVSPNRTLQLTSRVLNMNGYFPDYCWWGWKSNYIHIVGTDVLSTMDIKPPKRDANWIKNMHMAFSSYSNVMYMIALSNMVTDPLTRFDESYRYLKEVIKDGISLGLSVHDYPNFDYSVIKEWKNRTEDFYSTYYGEREATIVGKVLDIEKNYFPNRTKENAELLQKMFCELHTDVYEKGFKARVSEICGDLNINWNIPKWY